jgi:hypothetical protein
VNSLAQLRFFVVASLSVFEAAASQWFLLVLNAETRMNICQQEKYEGRTV